MRRASKFRAIAVVFLLALLLGGSATLSVTAAEVTLVLAIVIIAIIIVGSIIKSKLEKQRTKSQ